VLKYPVAIRELDRNEGGGFLAEIPDLPGCMADGETIAEAIANVTDAASEWIATAKQLGRQLPDSSQSFSGKWVQRVPKSLHQRLAVEARREGVSLNAFATALLAEGIAAAHRFVAPAPSPARPRPRVVRPAANREREYA